MFCHGPGPPSWIQNSSTPNHTHGWRRFSRDCFRRGIPSVCYGGPKAPQTAFRRLVPLTVPFHTVLTTAHWRLTSHHHSPCSGTIPEHQ
jgi:hypothetical protein